MYPTEGEQAHRIRATYVAQNATHETSKAIIETIAAKEGVSTAKVCHILRRTMGGPGYIRWTKADQVWDDEGELVRAAFAASKVTPRDPDLLEQRQRLVRQIADDHYFPQKAITEYAKAKDFWPWNNEERIEYTAGLEARKREEEDRARRNAESRRSTEELNNHQWYTYVILGT